ncbi:MAG: hypothetical protein B6D62_02425 [Candidatus Cloacimonas sp. 4484_275]|nr:MAG: hypothetical protein B6D62_02425 [Candidatus Cloacimonas sp. 4484_275]
MIFWIRPDDSIYLFQLLKAAKISDDYKEIRLFIKDGLVSINGVVNRKQRVILRDGDVVTFDKKEIVVKERKSETPTEQELERNYEERVRHGKINEWTSKPLKSEEEIDEQIVQLSEKLHYLFISKNKTVSFAESCTGGMVQQYLTDNSGSSAYFLGGIVAYSNQAKMRILKVKKTTLENYGAVSKETAKEMAIGVQKLFQSDVSASVTGIAGPTGGSDDKPVGTVFIAVKVNNRVFGREFLFNGTRDIIRKKTVKMLFEFIFEILTQTKKKLTR